MNPNKHYPYEYINYLVHFHGLRDYFECHEILEDYWKQKPAKERQQVWVGLIQIAVSLYHQRRGNFAGSEKMMAGAIRILSQEKTKLVQLGLAFEPLLEMLRQRKMQLATKQPYTSLDLPIDDSGLIQECKQMCKEKGIEWGVESDLTNEYLLHKHTLRDRSDVIEERQRQMDKKRKK